MLIDKKTLSDLEIFRSGNGNPTLFSLIDQCVTTGGSSHLHHMFLNPPPDLQTLLEQQQTIRHLTGLPGNLTLPVNNIAIKSLESYLSSNISTVSSEAVSSSLYFRISDKPSFQLLKSSLGEVMNFVLSFSSFIFQNKLHTLPAFAGCAGILSELIEAVKPEAVLEKLRNKKFRFYEVLRADLRLRKHYKQKLQASIEHYFVLDALCSMAKANRKLNLQFPEFVTENGPLFRAEGLYHPFIKNPVPASLAFEKENNFVYLTGPNMSGKSTLLKASGIAVFLSHLGMGVPAFRLQLSYFDCLFTSLNTSDSVTEGYSYFYNEVRRIKELATKLHAGESVFVLFDELFRGTNVKDAFEASALIIKALLLQRKSLFFISSHLWEIGNEIKGFDNVRTLYLESFIEDDKPRFSYRLIEGISDMRLGLHIIRNENILQLLNTSHHDIH